MTRILFVDHTPIAGGAQLVLADHLRHLDRTRFTPLVACTPDVPALVERYRTAGAEVHFTPLPRLRVRSAAVLPRLLHAAWKLRTLVRREKIDLVVANTSRAAYVASVALAGTGVPSIWWVRDFLFGRRIFGLLRRAPARIICVSRTVREYYGGTGDAKFEVVYVGNDIYRRIETLPARAVAAERARWGLAPEHTVIGFIGRVVADKGVEDVIAAVAEVHRDFPDLRLLVVGTGNNQLGDVEAQVRAESARSGRSFVAFAGFQGNEALYYNLIDIFVLGTRAPDAYATSLIQAMMAGKPVVATATGGTPEIVRDRETGLLVPPSSPRAMAAALRELLTNRALASRLAQAGHRLVMEQNREDVTTAQVERVYEEVIRGR